MVPLCPCQLQEAALSALASLAKDNETLALRLAKGPPGQERQRVHSLCYTEPLT